MFKKIAKNSPETERNLTNSEKRAIIKIYTTKTCIYCHALMDWLDNLSLTYEEIDATQFPEIAAVPVTEIEGERIVGFDRPAIKKALKKAGLL